MLMNQHFPVKNVAFAVSQPVLIESIQKKKKKQTNKQANQTMAEGREQAGHLQPAVLDGASLLGPLRQHPKLVLLQFLSRGRYFWLSRTIW